MESTLKIDGLFHSKKILNKFNNKTTTTITPPGQDFFRYDM
jgi:hypothetical protein